MKQFLALMWLRWRLVLNCWRAKKSSSDRMAGLLFVVLFALFSVVLGLASALFVSSLEFIPNRQELYSAFGLIIFSVVLMGWVLSSLRMNFGLLPSRNLFIFPLSPCKLSVFNLFSLLITQPGLYFYPPLLGFWVGTLRLGRITPSSAGFWLISVEMLAFVLLSATMAEFLGNGLENALRQRASASRLTWGLAALGILVLVLHFYFPSKLISEQTKGILHPEMMEFSQFLPQGTLVAGIRREVFHDADGPGHLKTILSFFVLILIGNGLNIIVLKKNLRNDVLGKQEKRSRGQRVVEKPGIYNPLFSDQSYAIFWKELKSLFMSSLGKLGLSSALFLSLGSGFFKQQISSLISSWNYIPARVDENTSAFVLFTFFNSLILFYPVNCFGFDGKGLALFFITPIQERKVFQAKNMAWLVFAELTLAGVILIPTGLKVVPIIHNPGPVLFSFQTYLVLILMCGNFLSVLFPMKFDIDRLRNATAGKSMPMVLVTVVWALASGMTMALMMWASTFRGGVQYLIIGSGLLGAVVIYRKSLPVLEKCLRRNKEPLMQTVAWLS